MVFPFLCVSWFCKVGPHFRAINKTIRIGRHRAVLSCPHRQYRITLIMPLCCIRGSISLANEAFIGTETDRVRRLYLVSSKMRSNCVTFHNKCGLFIPFYSFAKSSVASIGKGYPFHKDHAFSSVIERVIFACLEYPKPLRFFQTLYKMSLRTNIASCSLN